VTVNTSAVRGKTCGVGAAPATSALLERDVELGRLCDALAEAGSGRGRVIFVGGEAGIGKSSLVSTFAASVGDGTRVAFGRGDALVAELAAIAHKM
jgi:predicted ATP-dependent serine protease